MKGGEHNEESKENKRSNWPVCRAWAVYTTEMKGGEHNEESKENKRSGPNWPVCRACGEHNVKVVNTMKKVKKIKEAGRTPCPLCFGPPCSLSLF
jgi:hypothetical protein